MTLKRRIDISIAIILAGAFIGLIGFSSAVAIGLYAGLVPAVLGLLGLTMIIIGTVSLAQRRRLSVVIDSSGITIPTGNLFRIGEPVHIPREVIATIGKDESLRGRLIAIALRPSGKVTLQARHYCELKDFIAHCKAHGLPTA